MQDVKALSVVIAAGGTGGHMFPARAMAQELQNRGHRISLITDRRGSGFGPDLSEVATHRISAGAVVGGSLLRKLSSFARLGLGYLQAGGILRKIRADVVVGFGGYPSVPTVLAAAHQGRRIVLHEQNAVLGSANRFLASHAQAIATSFQKVEGLRPVDRNKLVYTGNPVRPAILGVRRRPYAIPSRNGRLRILVTGGSQGAVVFNEIVPKAVATLSESLRQRIDIVQQVPGGAIPEVKAKYDSCGVEASLAAFFDDMPQRLQVAHLVICRAGASTVAELAAAGRPAILVPYPSAAEDHQTSNAVAFVEAGGGWLMPQAALTPQSLAQRLTSLFGSSVTLTHAASCARGFCREGAAMRLADVVCGDVGQEGDGHDLTDDDDKESDREVAA